MLSIISGISRTIFKNRKKIYFTIALYTIIILLIYILYINLSIDIAKNKYIKLIKEDKPTVEINIKN